MRPVAALKFLLLDFIIALRKFVQSGTTRKPTRGTTLAHLRSIPGSVASHPPAPHPQRGHGSHPNGALIMKIEWFAGQREAREALVLSVAGVTTIMLIANLVFVIWH